MGSTVTGDLYSQEQFDSMSLQERDDLGLVRLEPDEATMLEPMTRQQRRKWLRDNKQLGKSHYSDPKHTKRQPTRADIKARRKRGRK